MKKAMSIILSMVIAFTVAILPVSAETVNSGNPTMCFDNKNTIDLFKAYPPETTGLSFALSDKKAQKGYSYILYADVPENTELEGLYFSASDIGLKNLENCTITFDYCLSDAYKEYSNSFTVFSQGVIWYDETVTDSLVTGKKDDTGWRTATITLPESATNTSFGIGISTQTGYKGTVMNIDNLTVTDKNGDAVVNVGDYENVKIEEGYKDITVTALWVTIVQIAVIVIILFIVIVILSKLLKKRKERFR